jgi:hypothetical protein
MIPFIFLDNQVGELGESAHLAFDETELECFEVWYRYSLLLTTTRENMLFKEYSRFLSVLFFNT